MGLRLSGPALKHKTSADILSDGIVKGAVQVQETASRLF